MIFSRRKVSERLEISETQLRTAIARLKSTHEIAHESTNQFTLITVVNWASYQNEGLESTHESTHDLVNEQPTNNQRTTTPKERIERKEGKEKKITPPVKLSFDPFTSAFAEKWQMWRNYKANEHKDSYKTTDSEQHALNKLIRISGRNEETAFKIIMQSIENHYKGLFELNGSVQKPAKEKKYTNL